MSEKHKPLGIESSTTLPEDLENGFESPRNIKSPEDSVECSSIKHIWRQGWRVGLTLCAAMTGMICCINTAVLIWISTSLTIENGVASFLEGSCSRVHNVGLGVHLAINIVSTLLLAASNYTLQILNSPSRSDVDQAHRQGKWLDIGIPSLRNLRNLPPRHAILWLCLGLTSIPLHLLYNSVSFSAIAAYDYTYAQATSEIYDILNSPASSNLLGGQEQLEPSQIQNMSVIDCVDTFANSYVTGYSRVFVLVDEISNSSSVYIDDMEQVDDTSEVPYAWVCGDAYTVNPYADGSIPCTKTHAMRAAKDNSWYFRYTLVKSCIAIKEDERCRLVFSYPIMIVVILMNFGKLIVMILTLNMVKDQRLVTVGDAVASFLKDSDPTTKDMCMATKKDFNICGRWRHVGVRKWESKRYRWRYAPSRWQWIALNGLVLIALVLAVSLLFEGMRTLKTYNIVFFWNLGMGAVNPVSFLRLQFPNLLAAVLLANTPQLALSLLYVMYNTTFTTMVMADEWGRFGTSRKSLRVSHPYGKQRSTYYLQLPFKYSVPLIVLSILLHWLVSQSLFLAYVPIYLPGGLPDNDPVISIGYSCISIIFAISLGVAALLLVNVIGHVRRYKGDLPLVGTCSAAISAACHAPYDDWNAAFEKVKWGVTCHSVDKNVLQETLDSEKPLSINIDYPSFEHCSISSFKVTRPVEGNLYA